MSNQLGEALIVIACITLLGVSHKMVVHRIPTSKLEVIE